MPIFEILSVGEELLWGLITDTNAASISRKLREIGFSASFRQTCGDDRAHLTACLKKALSRSDVIVVTGGLGPTYDDVTRDAVAEATGRSLVFHEETADRIRAFFARRGRAMADNNLLQAYVPDGAEVLPNDYGTAPGIWLETEGKLLILLPGVPREMERLMEEQVLPRLAAQSGKAGCVDVLHFFGITESELDTHIPEDLKNGADPAVAPFAGTGEVELHISAVRSTRKEARQAVCEAEQRLLKDLGGFCYGSGKTTLEQVLVERFARNGLTVATAESCTGGLLAKRLTDVPGSSAVLKSGVVAYSEEMKTRLLGVSPSIFSGDGVYSEACAVAMARGVRALTDSDFGVGVTGIAGPGGATERDPVGAVYIAVSGKNGETARRFVLGHGKGERGFIRHLAASHALAMTLSQAGLFSLEPEKDGKEK